MSAPSVSSWVLGQRGMSWDYALRLYEGLNRDPRVEFLLDFSAGHEESS
jgi:hypothetical protein